MLAKVAKYKKCKNIFREKDKKCVGFVTPVCLLIKEEIK